MKIHEREKAIVLRKEGYSLNEIKALVPVSKSTLSTWLRNIQLSKAAQNRIETCMTNGQLASIKSKYQ